MSGIALETLNYAKACVTSGERALALEALTEPSNGLSLDQQNSARGIIESAGELREGRELSRFENRMLGVVQPATLEFLENPKAIAAMMSSFMYREPQYLPGKDFVPTLVVLGIQTSHSAIHQYILRQKLKDQTWFFLSDIIGYMDKLRHPETGDSLSLVEFLELCPEFVELRTGGGEKNDVATYRWLERIGEALKKCKNTKFCSFTSYLLMPIEELRKLKTFPHLTHFTFGVHQTSVEEIKAVLEFPFLKYLEFRESSMLIRDRNLQVLQNTKLEEIEIFWDRGIDFCTEEQLHILRTIPVKVLRFDCSNISDDDLARLLQIPALETVDLSVCRELTKEGVIHFLRGINPSTLSKIVKFISRSPTSKIKTVILEASERGDGMTRAEIEEIQTEFPNIVEIGPR